MPDTANASGGIALDIAQITDMGSRSANEDRLSRTDQGQLSCFVVSDGVGGEKGGAIASQTVTDAIIEHFTQHTSFTSASLQAHIDYASAQLKQKRIDAEQLQEMSATVAVVLIDRTTGAALLAHMGDTRIYLFRENSVRYVTKDHSLIQQLIDAGYCKTEQLRRHPQRSTLFAAIGAEGDAEVTGEPMELRPDDAILICTDGFWEWINEEEMEMAAASAANAAIWLESMQEIVMKEGRLSTTSADNYTAFAIRITGGGQ